MDRMAKTISFLELVRRPPLHHNEYFTPQGPPKDLTAADRAFKQMTKTILGMQAKQDWKYSLRPSGLPLCQWEAMLAELVGPDGPQETLTLAKEFYFGVGHVAHEIVQKWLGRAGFLFGPYMCMECRVVVVSQGTPKACEQGCKRSNWKFKEINLVGADHTGLLGSAHADGLIHFDWQKPNHFYVVDVKTCNMRNLPRPEYGLTASYHKDYLHQTAIYVHLLGKSEDMHVDGTVFLFVPRDDPNQMTCVVIDQSETNEAIFQEAIGKYREAKQAAQTGDAENIARYCTKKPSDEDCPFNDLCFDRRRTIRLFQSKNLLPILPDF